MDDYTAAESQNQDLNTPKEESSDRAKLIKFGLLLTLLAALAGGYLWWNNLRNYVNTDNAKVTADIVDVSPKTSGRLEILAVQEGETVQGGQVLAELDNAQLKINLDQAKASLDLSQANYEKLPDDLKSAQATVDKAQQALVATQAQLKAAQAAEADSSRNLTQSALLLQSGAISQESLALSTSAATKAQAAVEAAQAAVMANQAAVQDAQAKLNSLDKTGAAIYLAQLQQAQSAYQTAQLNLANSVLRAPVGGTVLRVAVQVGETIAVGQTVVTISDLDSTWISANIEEDKFGRLRVGQTVTVQIDAFPGISFDGQISELGGATQSTFALIPTETTSGNFTKVKQRFSCKITVDKRDKVLKPGMSAVINIHTGH
jgi:membrane fusion protein, multidrug efflux system